MNTQPPIKSTLTEIMTNEFAKRFRDFRVRYVNKNLTQAAELIGTSKGQLSSIENGRKRPNLEIIEALIKDFNLNTEWLATGNGDKQTTGPAQPTAANSLSQAFREIDVMRKVFKISAAQVTAIFDKLDQQEKTIAALQKRLDKMEDEK